MTAQYDCDEFGLLNLLKEQCLLAGSQKAWANSNRVSPQYLNDVLTGKREPGKAIYTALGFTKHIVYLRVSRHKRTV